MEQRTLAPPAFDDARAGGDGVSDPGLGASRFLLADHRPHVRRRIVRIADLQPAHRLHEPGGKQVDDVGVHEQPLGGRAHLPRAAEADAAQRAAARAQVRVLADDRRGDAAQFERDRPQTDAFAKPQADVGSPGEGVEGDRRDSRRATARGRRPARESG